MLLLAAALAAQGTVGGDIAREPIRLAIEAHRAEVVRCYDEELARRPQSQGKLVVLIDIAPDGAVADASLQRDEVGSKELSACVLDAVRSWKFPMPGEPGIRVTWPFVFRSAAK